MLALIPILGVLWIAIELGLRVGSRGDNRFGADPLGLQPDYQTVSEQQNIINDFTGMNAVSVRGVVTPTTVEHVRAAVLEGTGSISVGRVVDEVAAQVVDANDALLPAGNVGLIRFRSNNVATSYFNNPEAGAHAFRDGWFYPMDLVAINQDGYIFLKGRADDVISIDSIKFYPIEIENVLMSHPDATEAAAFGWSHPKHGELPEAAVTTSAPVSDKDLMKFCRGHLAAYKVPGIIVMVPEMPRNALGKILKGKIKQALKQELAKQS